MQTTTPPHRNLLPDTQKIQTKMTEQEFHEEIEEILEILIQKGLVERFIREDGEWVYAPTTDKLKRHDT
jgi:hypothetical protein